MNYQVKAMHLSFLLHSALIFSVIILSRNVVPIKVPLVIDFTVETVNEITAKPAVSNRAPSTPQRMETAPAISHPVVPAHMSKKSAKRASPSRAEDHPQKIALRQSTSAPPRPLDHTNNTAKDAVKNQTVLSNSTPTLKEHKTPPAALTATSPGDTGKIESEIQAAALDAWKNGNNDAGGIRNKGEKYLQNNFDYIRNLIMRNLSFPAAARKLGWSGKILISFVIKEDGNVEDIKIITGSGHEILDINVISAIHRTAPLPKPPVKAQLILPIVYSLK